MDNSEDKPQDLAIQFYSAGYAGDPNVDCLRSTDFEANCYALGIYHRQSGKPPLFDPSSVRNRVNYLRGREHHADPKKES